MTTEQKAGAGVFDVLSGLVTFVLVSGVATTNHHTLGLSEQQTRILSHVEASGIGRAVLPPGPPGTILPAFSSCQGLSVPGLWPVPPASALTSLCESVGLCASSSPPPSLHRHQPLDLGPVLIQYDLISTELIKLQIISK